MAWNHFGTAWPPLTPWILGCCMVRVYNILFNSSSTRTETETALHRFRWGFAYALGLVLRLRRAVPCRQPSSKFFHMDTPMIFAISVQRLYPTRLPGIHVVTVGRYQKNEFARFLIIIGWSWIKATNSRRIMVWCLIWSFDKVWLKLATMLRHSEAGLCWLAPVCSSWVWINRILVWRPNTHHLQGNNEIPRQTQRKFNPMRWAEVYVYRILSAFGLSFTHLSFCEWFACSGHVILVSEFMII